MQRKSTPKPKIKPQIGAEAGVPSLSLKENAEILRHTYKRLKKPLLIVETQKDMVEKMSQPGQPLSPSNTRQFLNCPVKQLSHCCFYEYARYSDGMILLAETFHGGRLLDESSPEDWLTNETMARFPLWIIADCPEFPNTPWLDLPSDRRMKLSKRTRPTFRPADPPSFRDLSEALDFADVLSLFKKGEFNSSDIKKLDSRIDVKKLVKQVESFDLTQDRLKLLKALSNVDPNSDLARFLGAGKVRTLARYVSGFQSVLKAVEMAPHLAEMLFPDKRFLVEVDLRRDKTDLVEDFTAWIDRKKAEYKQLFARQDNSFENRGRNSPKDLLRKLSAYRIHRELNWTHEKLAEHFPHIYAKSSDWSVAIRGCNKLIKKYFPSPEPPSS